MPFLSGGKSYIVADSIKRRWIRNVLGLSGGADREGLFREFKVNYQSMCT